MVTRYSSSDILEKASSTAVDNGYEPLDLTEDVVLESPEIPLVEGANELVEKALVYYFIFTLVLESKCFRNNYFLSECIRRRDFT